MTDQFKNVPSEEAPPKATFMNTFRAYGYNLQTAIADLIDNCITAKAENVWIDYLWNGEESSVTITDDGVGMNREELVEAMTPGSKDAQDEREENDLGRFGLGLKSSSFSQCKTLTVVSKKENHAILNRCWDLDYVDQTKKWNLLDYLSDQKYKKRLNDLTHGTTVIWEKLDRLVGNSNVNNESARKVFLEEFENTEEHLNLVFHRYLEKKRLSIWMNGKRIEGWDPFMKESQGGQIIARESLDQNRVVVKCCVLPHISKLSKEERIWAKTDQWYDLQGFYIYRNSRLLLYGDWLGLFSKNEHYKNARILIDISNTLDHEWKIDIKKASATPSANIRKDLIRLGKKTRKAAGAIHRFRGNQIMLDDTITSFSFQPIWKAKKMRDNSRHYYINTEHPLIKDLLEQDNIKKSDLKTIIELIGSSTPVESIIQYHSEEPESHELRQLSNEPDSVTIELAQKMYKALTSTGTSKDIAIKQIFNIEPFNQYTQLIEYFS